MRRSDSWFPSEIRPLGICLSLASAFAPRWLPQSLCFACVASWDLREDLPVPSLPVLVCGKLESQLGNLSSARTGHYKWSSLTRCGGQHLSRRSWGGQIPVTPSSGKEEKSAWQKPFLSQLVAGLAPSSALSCLCSLRSALEN